MILLLVKQDKLHMSSRSPPINITITNFPHKFFAENVICGLSFKVPISSEFAKTKEVLNKFAFNNEIDGMYVLCPINGKNQNNKKIPTQIKLGVTKKAKIQEPTRSAVNRHIATNIGVMVPESEINCIQPDQSNPSVYLILSENTKCVTNDIHSEMYDNNDVDIHRKLGICVIGNKCEMTRLLSSETFGCCIDANDIIGVICIPIRLALKQTGGI